MTDLALDRGLPVNLDVERFVLGAVLMDETLWGPISGAVSVDDFSLEKHRRLFLRMGEIHERGERIDRVTLANELKRLNQLESVDGISYIVSLDEGLPALCNFDQYVRILQEKATLRRLILECSRIQDRCFLEQDSPGELISDAERLLREMGSRGANKGNLASARESLAGIDLNQIGKVPANVIRTPYHALNRILVGFAPGELIVMGARPSSGKSACCLEIAIHACLDGRTTALFSLEMKRPAILTRAACNRGQVDNLRVRHGSLSDTERYSFMRAMSEIGDLPLYLDDRSQTLPAMMQEIRRMPTKPHLVIIDHLHLMRTVGRHENRNNELAAITRELKLFAGESGSAVLLLAQLNRANEKDSRPPELRDLRDCGAIEQDADVVLFLHKREDVGTESQKVGPVPVDLIVAKQREGVARLRIPLSLMGKWYRFFEIDQEIPIPVCSGRL